MYGTERFQLRIRHRGPSEDANYNDLADFAIGLRENHLVKFLSRWGFVQMDRV